ncbi:MAG: STAS domain-containing protein [Piscirickettsiaceae bacterium]|nr:STAS domain-containing protein [Piscirickettsiaceae bacterium]
MNISTETDGNKYIIKIHGRFDFNVQSEFREAYEVAEKNSLFIIDFLAADYMDSSALGMLLLLRDYAGGESALMELINCKAEISNILEISNFQKLFKIS